MFVYIYFIEFNESEFLTLLLLQLLLLLPPAYSFLLCVSFNRYSRSFNFLELWRTDETDIDDLNWILSYWLTHALDSFPFADAQKLKVSQIESYLYVRGFEMGKDILFLLKYTHKHIFCCWWWCCCCCFVCLFSIFSSFIFLKSYFFASSIQNRIDAPTICPCVFVCILCWIVYYLSYLMQRDSRFQCSQQTMLCIAIRFHV